MLFAGDLLFKLLDFPALPAQNEGQVVNTFFFIPHILNKFEFLFPFGGDNVGVGFKVSFHFNKLIEDAFLVVFELFDFGHLVLLELGQLLLKLFGFVA